MSILSVCMSLCTVCSLSWICRTLACFYMQLYLLGNSICMHEILNCRRVWWSVALRVCSGAYVNMCLCVSASGYEWIAQISVPLIFLDSILVHFHSTETPLAWPNPVTIAPHWYDFPPQLLTVLINPVSVKVLEFFRHPFP